ncbi:GNAT family N-acetyltransferase [Gorillibacterium sp. sgz500922]|uniref:GNAT family N-acetyltransferase n=1 Tax=Gorillibacterium sp. sgz500922 TaxID=3446694 RepID=UPI003F672DD2
MDLKEWWTWMHAQPFGSETYREWEEMQTVVCRLYPGQAEEVRMALEEHPNAGYLHWGAAKPEALVEAVRKTLVPDLDKASGESGTIKLEFVPQPCVAGLRELGFEVTGCFVDYWSGLEEGDPESRDSSPKPLPYLIRPLSAEEAGQASDVTKACSGQSRGFTGETAEFVSEWLEEPHARIIAAELDGALCGLVFVQIYDWDSEKGPVLWIRELAVHPGYQRRGIGAALLDSARSWGREAGAVRSFLAADTENAGAVRLYERLGYRRSAGEGQINMERPFG